MMCDMYVTGVGQRIYVHTIADCHGERCVIHNPSNHSMIDFPTLWRGDRGLMERICPHGVRHPDPDHLDYISRTMGEDAMNIEAIHGCDGCCS